MADSGPLSFGPVRGLFWHASIRVPRGKHHPSKAAPGTLRVNVDGGAELDLDGVLSRLGSGSNQFLEAIRDEDEDVVVHGILIDDNQSVILEDAARNGGVARSAGISTQRFQALRCFIAKSYRSPASATTVKRCSVPLNGFEEWLSLKSLRRTGRQDDFSVTYQPRPDTCYVGDRAKLIYQTHLQQVYGFPRSTYDLQLQDVPEIVIEPNKNETLGEVAARVAEINEALLLLTGSERQVAWPTVHMTAGRGAAVGTLYFSRPKPVTDDPWRGRNSWVPFGKIEDHFLELLDRWRILRRELGAAAYSYTSTRRGMNLYAEHHLISLIWGLESYSRQRGIGAPSRRQLARLRRVKDLLVSDSDKQWLQSKLKGLQEPELEARLRAVLDQLPVSFVGTGLRDFANRLAVARNQLSHDGRIASPDLGSMSSSGYAVRLARALSGFYHATLLRAMGVADDVVAESLLRGHTGAASSFYLSQIGLKLTERTPNQH